MMQPTASVEVEQSSIRSTGGDPLVLLPGMNCSARLWSFLGLGNPITPTLTEPTLVGQVERLLDELPPRFALAGLSLGGIVAMAVARQAPERVSRLCLMSTKPDPPTDEQRTAWARQRATLAAGASARELQSESLPVLLSPAVITGRRDLVGLTLAMADEVGSAGLDAQLALQATRIDERPTLARLRCPVLLLAAQNDALCGVDRHLLMHRVIAGSRLVVVEQSAHLSPLERPAEVAAEVHEWLADGCVQPCPGTSRPDS